MALKSPKNPSPKTKRVRFDLHAPQAQEVSLAGEFNGWDVNSLPMKKDKRGTWKVGIALSPGRYEYRFFVDGTWQDDPKAHEKVDNPFGTQNRVKNVT